MGAVIPAFAASSQVLYGQIASAGDATIWNGTALEAYNQSHWALYTVVATEQAGSGRYIMTIPGGLPNGRYFISVFLALSGTPAFGDTPIDFVFFDWRDGNALGLGSGLNIGQINGSSPAAVNLGLSANTFVIGATIAGSLTTQVMTTNLAPSGAFANMYAGRILYFTSGVNAGLAVLITAFLVLNGRVTFIAYGNSGAPSAPGVGDTFIIF